MHKIDTPDNHISSPVSENQAGHKSRSGFALLAILGPGAAALHESGALFQDQLDGLWPVGLVVTVSGISLLTGIGAARRKPRWPGLVAIAANAPVLIFYGFLLAFFGLGGSR